MSSIYATQYVRSPSLSALVFLKGHRRHEGAPSFPSFPLQHDTHPVFRAVASRDMAFRPYLIPAFPFIALPPLIPSLKALGSTPLPYF